MYTHYILYRRAANIQYSPSDKKFKNFIEGKYRAGHLKSWQYRLKEQQYGHRNRLLLAGWLRVMVILVEMKKGYTDDDESIQFCLAHFDHQQISLEESLSLYLFWSPAVSTVLLSWNFLKLWSLWGGANFLELWSWGWRLVAPAPVSSSQTRAEQWAGAGAGAGAG